MRFQKGQPRPPRAGRKKGSRNRRTILRERALMDIQMGLELPADMLARASRHYFALGQKAFAEHKDKLADHYFSMMRQMAATAASYFTPRLVSVKSGAELTRPLVLEVVRFSDTAPLTSPALDPPAKQIEAQALRDLEDDFDDGFKSDRPPPLGRNGGT